MLTKDSGDPATGLTLSDIDIYLWRVNKSTGAREAVWSGENPTLEIGGGLYRRPYTSEDLDTYEYYAYAQYTGGQSLDSNYSLQECLVQNTLDAIASAVSGAGAITFTYTLTSSEDGSPIADASVWVTTDAAGDNVVASGTTDVNGQVVFYLDAATYYVWRQKSRWNFTNPDTEVVA